MRHERGQERPPVVVFTGLGVSNPVRDAELVRRISPTRHFDIYVHAGLWESQRSPAEVVSRARDVLESLHRRVRRPIGAIGLSASGAVPIAAARGMESVQAIVPISAPVNPSASLDQRGITRFEQVKKNAPWFIEFLEYFAGDVLPTLSLAEKNRILSTHGTMDSNVPREVSVLPGVRHKHIWTPPIPLPRKLHDVRHIYNIGRGLNLGTVRGFLYNRLAWEG